ncbi:MAG: rhodanese-like domain-containing protein [Acidiferrobacteraceae bacterium]|jgi:rhodanese-related sulfurtransferase|nr:rhodanese-like domain-containing protein [Acidiferrobacteraceae bacterium]MDP7569434.1 rhodanese-like domain-containing protein [Arenicellales bacterium]MBT3638691.1 rhodanese-like domain-containing protein [Acidiferrobacteraceae bacterium]MBT3770634.1 rhodanese-like domain-containing protein [Acidiferrobacteraceae bacterium]MBT4395630.1 rhodanese-like domain-containing protein [Acidiferrobacteraceae bacterium]|tara:strand:- start:621 stop:1043 length:423 start_codon:yes stop_codon:yes gene_type:complete
MDLDFIANNWHLFAALIVISLLIGIDTMRRGGAGANQVSAVQLPQLINQENAVVVDVCQPEEFRKGHIPAAINIPVEQIKEQLGQLEKFRKKDRPIVLSCRSGQRASRAAAVLRKNEFERVYTLSGGLAAWEKENLPLER